MSWALNWALEHIQLAVVIVIAIGGLIKKVRTEAQRAAAKKANQTQQRQIGGARPQNRPFDTEAAERTRRIQDEIRQKIEARRRALAQSGSARENEARPPEIPRPAYDPFTPEALQRENPPEVPRPPEPSRVTSERTLALARKLEAAKQREEKRRAKSKKAQEDSISIQVAPIALIPSSGPLMPSHPLRETLSDPEEVRRAIILSELLQPPLALR
jgi:hypothetical protein